MFFKSLFKSNPQHLLQEPLDMGALRTDVHSHLIPGIDDGAKTMDESIALIKAMKQMGYRKLITTPHIMNDYYRNNPEIIKSGLENLKKRLVDEKVEMEMEAAAEYMLDDGFLNKLREEPLLTFGNKFLLVEMSYIAEPPNLAQMLFEIQTSGYKIVLAHPERYNYWHNQKQKYTEMYDRGVYLQLNINSLTGWYSLESKKMAEWLIQNKLVSFVGSDLHNQNYLAELEKSRSYTLLKQLMEEGKLLNSRL